MRLATAQADELLDEPGDDPAEIRADLDTARTVEEEARERAQEAVMMLDTLQARAPDVWEAVHDRYRQKAFAQYADVLDETADALETFLESVDAATDARRGNQWLNVAAGSLAFPGWLTKPKHLSGSNARRWIDTARKRAERLRNEPTSFGTGYSRILREMREKAEQDD